MVFYTLCTHCRICNSPDLVEVLNLGYQSLTSIFPHMDEASPPSAPQVLVKCSHCDLVQMKHTVSADCLYTDNYGYRSGLNATMIGHLTEIARYLESFVQLEKDDIVVDIGANDATLLSKFPKDIHKLAIDPSGTQFLEYYPKDVVLVPEFFSRDTYTYQKKAKIVTTISMFYDLPHPQEFAKDVAAILDDEKGVWMMEQSYMPTMIKNLSFDTICHEHLEYYTLKQIDFLAKNAGLRVIDISFNDCNGGSFRLTLCHENASYLSNENALRQIRKKEASQRWETLGPYKDFENAFNLQRDALMDFLRSQKQDGKTIAIYGASTKGNTLLQYYGIDKSLITNIAERNPRKFGHKTPGTEIPIVSEEEVRNLNPDFMLVLPWHFKQEFLRRETRYLENGGTFIFPLPKYDIVTKSTLKTAVIIGSSGQLGTYLTDVLIEKKYRVFCICRSPTQSTHPNVISIVCDALKFDILTTHLDAIKPDEIYNLAAVTESSISVANPLYTMSLNAELVFALVEYLKKRPLLKLFQAGSVEMFKGNSSTTSVCEKDMIEKIHPRTPYAIAKVSAFWAIRNARELDGLYTVTGICSNIESRMRRPTYVTRKIIDYFKKGDFSLPLQLGNAKSMCDWIHAKDVACAVYETLQQSDASDYVISSGTPNSVASFCLEVAKQVDMPSALWNDEYTQLMVGSKLLIKADDISFLRPHETSKPITYLNTKILCIYEPRYSSLEYIVRDMLFG